MVYVKVPATSANLGAGFDSLGLALGLYNYIGAEEYDGCLIESLDGADIPTDENNLIYRSAKLLYDYVGAPFKGLHLVQKDNIPQTRGLGSSSACIVGGLFLANQLLGCPLDEHQMLNLATKIEGHPDNVAPALLGGFVASAIEGETVYYVKSDLRLPVDYVVVIPPTPLETSKARAALPNSYSRSDAVYNLSRSALMAASMLSGNLENIKVAAGDKLHQDYRLPLIPGGQNVFDIADKLGAAARFISGAGSTLLILAKKDDPNFINNLRQELGSDPVTANFTIKILQADNRGCSLCSGKEI